MALLGTNRMAGHVWPGQLEAYQINAPGEEWIVDPSLPILGYDPRFNSDGIVVGRGRLVGPKATAVAASTGITTSQPGASHKTVLTIADGINTKPLGFAPYNIFKQWSERANGMPPIMQRNAAIAVPYIETHSPNVGTENVNSVFGALTQGDKVTAHPGYAKGAAATMDPRVKGMIVKWVPKTVSVQALVASGTTAYLTNAPYQCFTPKVLYGIGVPGTTGAFTIAGTPTWDATGNTTGCWKVIMSSATTHVAYEYGQEVDMIAGEVYGLETLTDMPGYIKWVTDNFGAWTMPYGNLTAPTWVSSTQVVRTGTASATGKLDSLGNGAFAMDTNSSGVGINVRVDASMPITVEIGSGASYTDSTGAVVAVTAWVTLPTADRLITANDSTMGMNYSINPVTGVLQLFGVYLTSTGAVLTSEALVRVTYYKDTSLRDVATQPHGIAGLTDGSGGSGVIGTEPQFDVSGSIGIMRVAIH